VLIGRTFSDLVRNMVTFAVMLAVAFTIGFRFDGGLWRGLVATAMLLGLGYALSWVQILIGLSVKSVEAANSGGFIWMFPITFVSSAFVSTKSMTPWLRRLADANPFTTITNAARALYNGRDPGNNLWQATAWIAGITLVFAALSVRRFTRTASR
jgi:ABC-2 type transport system permease protein